MAFDWGSLIGAAVSLYGANKGASAAKDAGKQAAAGTQASNDLIWNMFQQNQAMQQPFYNAGLQAQDRYLQLMGLNPTSSSAPAYGSQGFSLPSAASQAGGMQWLGNNSGTPTVNAQLYATDPRYKAAWDQATSEHQAQFGKGYTGDSNRNVITSRLQALYGSQTGGNAPASQVGGTPAMSQQQAFDAFRSTPGYQFGLDQGTKQVQASAAARGGLNSGATLKALQKFGTDYADQQGYTPYMNRLAGLFGGAQTAASQTGAYGQNAASQMGQNTMVGANARARSTYGAADSWMDGLNNAAGFAGQWYKNTYGGGH